MTRSREQGDIIPAFDPCHWLPVVDALVADGHAVLPGFFSTEACTALRAELQALDAAGALQPAAIGRGELRQQRSDIRGDRMTWLQPEWRAGGDYLACLDGLRRVLNEQLFLALAEVEAHYACYPPGAGYRRHVDRHQAGAAGRPGQGERVISTVTYLNEPGWPADGGGELVLHSPSAGEVVVPPEGGTLVVFRSDDLPHEVRPSRCLRYSIAGWMRTRALS